TSSAVGLSFSGTGAAATVVPQTSPSRAAPRASPPTMGGNMATRLPRGGGHDRGIAPCDGPAEYPAVFVLPAPPDPTYRRLPPAPVPPRGAPPNLHAGEFGCAFLAFGAFAGGVPLEVGIKPPRSSRTRSTRGHPPGPSVPRTARPAPAASAPRPVSCARSPVA